MAPSQEANGDNIGSLSDLLYNNGMLRVLIRIASMTGTRFSLRDKWLFEISEVEITRVG